ncbi:MAG: DUF1552 domain-containing protein [Akkermansiaceae bacterium]|nr:DUF1552 domain-containing protein [Akkermansiaceae bacterium]OUV09644.1 MAG: hypothetical protein CBC46_12805 [Verrucomicrobiaceae bacterium TMED86]
MANIQSNRWQISRRQTLKGLGATMALPFLEAMRPLHGQSASSGDPVRMACLFMPNGVRPDKWTPTGSGKTYKLSPILSPLEALKEEIMVISGLTNKASHGGDGHYFKTASWLTCTTIEKTVGSNVSSNGISIDQVAAQEIGNSTRLPSMELGTEPITSGIDRNVNLTRLYGSHISWKKPDVPLPCEINPRIAFDRLFRNRNKKGGAAAGNPDKSILDIVLDDANSLKRSLGDEDTHKLDQYLESVREVERRIENEASQLGAGQNLTPEALKQLAALSERINKAGGGSKNDFGSLQRLNPTEHVRLMMDIMVLAFWTDSTRVSTFMFGNAVSGKNFSFLDGVSGSHHSISHHKNDKKQLDQYQIINTWHTEQYAYMLQRMKEIPEGSATLLDNSMVLFGSGIRDGNAHATKDIPIVLGGGAKGQLKTGRHLETSGADLSSLYVGMLKRLGVSKQKVGEASRELRGI